MITSHCLAPPTPTNCAPTWDLRQITTGVPGAAGTATIALDNGYRLEICESNSQIRIINGTCDETTTVWGDSAVDWHGEPGSEGRFSGAMTFVLADSTKITLSTSRAHPGAEQQVDNIVVTRGEQSMIVDGLAAASLGDLRVHQGLQGYALDRLVSDGRVRVYENINGIGWVTSRDGHVAATSADLARPAPCAPEPKRPMLCQQLATMYHGCQPPRPPSRPTESPGCLPIVHAGKHGGVHHGKHGQCVPHGKHGYGVHHGKHGYDVVHQGKHGGHVHHGKHGHAPQHDAHCHGIHHGKHGLGIHEGKHGRYDNAMHRGKHGVSC
jgi:hypothetical protein